MQVCSEDIKDMLVAESNLGLTFATNLFIGGLPTKPRIAISIVDTSGATSPITLGGETYHYDSVQILSRDDDYLRGIDLLHDIMDLLHGRARETWNGSYYSLILCITKPALLYKDNNGDFIFVSNYSIQRR